MSRKKLVVSGDSWTAGVNERDKNGKPLFLTDPTKTVNHEFTLWPEYLADMLGMDVVNVALGGKGNEFIYNSIVDKLSSAKNVGLAITMWSDPDREDFVGVKTVERDSTVHNFVTSLRWFNAFQNYCESNNIPYIQCSACDTVSNDILSPILDHPVFYKMKEDRFYGWPIFRKIGGFNMSDKLNKIDPEMKKLRVSDEDTHPNTEGHKLIAEFLYKQYESVYD